ncbi:MAG: signal recognition particle-docking protein FtsY [Phycisphaerae bacterium]|nr:signal recognition particle-docking protein FtsY [Phycisphaerae bacterium]
MGLFKSAISAMRRGLRRTRDALGKPLGGLLSGRQLSDELIDEVETCLLGADVGVAATEEIVKELRNEFKAGRLRRGDDAIEFLREHLKARWSCGSVELVDTTARPSVILVVGINGAGKTTSIAKIAWSLKQQGLDVLVAAADTFRAGAVEQLAIWADRIGVDLVRGSSGADPASVAFDAAEAAVSRQSDVLVVDTAGRLHTQDDLMRQLTKIRDVLARKIPGAPHEVLLVLDATSGQNAIAQAGIFKESVDITGIFLAKLDGTARGGVVVAIHDQLDIPVKLIGLGERPEDVEPFDPGSFIDSMF